MSLKLNKDTQAIINKCSMIVIIHKYYFNEKYNQIKKHLTYLIRIHFDICQSKKDFSYYTNGYIIRFTHLSQNLKTPNE